MGSANSHLLEALGTEDGSFISSPWRAPATNARSYWDAGATPSSSSSAAFFPATTFTTLVTTAAGKHGAVLHDPHTAFVVSLCPEGTVDVGEALPFLQRTKKMFAEISDLVNGKPGQWDNTVGHDKRLNGQFRFFSTGVVVLVLTQEVLDSAHTTRTINFCAVASGPRPARRNLQTHVLNNLSTNFLITIST